MGEAFGKISRQLNEFWGNLSKSKRIGILGAFVVVVAIIVISSMLIGQTKYTVLYSNLSAEEAGSIMTRLEEMNIKAKAQGSSTILVDEAAADGVRMTLASEGLPKSGFNYDVFANGSGFGSTDFEKKKYLQFQLQDRLQASIKSLDNIEDAIVTISIPEDDSFVLDKDAVEASASVILKLRNGQDLTKSQIIGIEGLVAKSVPGLKESAVQIVDNYGNTLSSQHGEGSGLVGGQMEMENSAKDRLKKEVLSLLEPVFGKGKVLASVNVVLDFDKQQTESVTFTPMEDSELGIPVSVSESGETSSSSTNGGTVGVDANGGAPSYQVTGGEGESSESWTKTTNYEVNQIRDMVEKAQGTIKDISVSVVLDGEELDQENIEKVQKIVAGALGIENEEVVVQNMVFSGQASIDAQFEESKKVAKNS